MSSEQGDCLEAFGGREVCAFRVGSEAPSNTCHASRCLSVDLARLFVCTGQCSAVYCSTVDWWSCRSSVLAQFRHYTERAKKREMKPRSGVGQLVATLQISRTLRDVSLVHGLAHRALLHSHHRVSILCFFIADAPLPDGKVMVPPIDNMWFVHEMHFTLRPSLLLCASIVSDLETRLLITCETVHATLGTKLDRPTATPARPWRSIASACHVAS